MTAPGDRLDQVTADQDPVDRGPGDAPMAPALQLEDQAARTPAAVSSAQVAEHGLDLGAQLPRVRLAAWERSASPASPLSR